MLAVASNLNAAKLAVLATAVVSAICHVALNSVVDIVHFFTSKIRINSIMRKKRRLYV